MNNTIKAIILILCFVAVGVVGYMFYPLVTETIMGNKYYTSQEAQDIYDKGFNDGNNNKTELEAKVSYFEELVNEYYLRINELNTDIEKLEKQNLISNETISSLETSKQDLELQVENLSLIKTENEETISTYENRVKELQKKVDDLSNEKNTNQNEIVSLRNQIENLQTLNTQLQRTNQLNAETITTLNTQISNLNNQISDMTMLVQNNSSTVNTLNNRIAELEKSVAYYEQYISSLENNEQVVATFEFNGSVYNIQILQKGAKASVINPTSTDKVIFNYWEINGERIDLNTYTFNSNVKVTANVTLKNKVQFNVSDSVFDTQYVLKNSTATLPENPVKNNYVFEYWTLNGIDKVDIESYQITEDIIFYAKFTRLHNVTFIYEDEILQTQQIKNGEYAIVLNVENTRYKVFNGWLLNGANVNVESYKITSDTVFNASITYFYDVNFKLDKNSDYIYNSQIIQSGYYASLPLTPTKEGYLFSGWTIDGENLIDISSFIVDKDINFIAKFTKLHNVTFMNESEVFDILQVKDGENIIFSSTPTKDGFAFNGWSINGTEIVDISSLSVTSDLVLIALFRVVGFSNSGYLSFSNSSSTLYATDEVDGKIYIYGSYAEFGIFDVETETLEEVYSLPINPYGITYYNGRVYICGSKGGFCYYDIQTKTLSENIGPSIDCYFYGAFGYGDNIYLGGSKGSFIIYNISSNSFGSLITSPFGNTGISGFVEYKNRLYLSDWDGYLAYFDLNTNSFSELIKTPLVDALYKSTGSLYLLEDKIYFGSNFLCIYDLSTNTFSEIFEPFGYNRDVYISEKVYIGNNVMILGGSMGYFKSYDIVTNTVIEEITVPSIFKAKFSSKCIRSVIRYGNKLFLFGDKCAFAVYNI